MVMKITYNPAFALMIEVNHEKTQSGWSVPGFEPGTSRMRVSCVTTEPPRSVTYFIFIHIIQEKSTPHYTRIIIYTLPDLLPWAARQVT